MVERIRTAMPSMRDVVLVGLLPYAGLRPAEAFALTWASVTDNVLVIDRSFTAGEIKTTKTRRRRTVERSSSRSPMPSPCSGRT